MKAKLSHILLFLLGIGYGFGSFTQTYNMPGGTINTCSGNFYDTGGAGGNYLNNQNITQTFCSNVPGQSPILTFTAFNIESGWDQLTIYDGPTTASPILGSFTGTASPGVIQGTASCITIVFTSDGSVTYSGWAATISCGTPPPPSTNYNMSNGSVVACSGNFYDSGGPGGNYANNQNLVFTICPDTPGSQVQVNFTSFNVENGWDFLTIYDGNTTGAPSLGIFSGTTSPGTITASVSNPTGCLTFRFTSDGSVTPSGWAATISCTVPCQNITATITSTSPVPVAGVIKACQNEDITFNGSAVFSDSGTGAVYTWDFGDGTTATGTSVTHQYTAGGAFSVGLTVTDNVGCSNLIIPSVLVQISTTPDIVTGVAPDPLCLGQSADLTSNVTMTPHEVNCTPPVSGVTFLPDGSGVSYNSQITVDCYNAGQSVSSPADIADICINMEHSYVGDLNIMIICPSGQSIVLKPYPGGGGTYLGAPIDSGPGPGTGSTYCFAPGAVTPLLSGPTVIAGTPPGASIAPGTYAPTQPFTNLNGCPLNGNWTLQITDNLAIDDGYIFDWDVNFTIPAPAAASFTPVIVTQGWQVEPGLTSTGVTTATVTPVTTGLQCYTYEVVDDFGCTYTEDQCVTVDPYPEMTSASTAETCSNVALAHVLTADVPATFSWFATDNPNVTGETTTPQIGSVINNTLINTTSVPQFVTYSVTPSGDPGGCEGLAQTVTVTVNPLPTLTNPSTHSICSGAPVDFTITADIPATFSWFAPVGGNVSGQSTIAQTGDLITDVLTSTSGVTETIVYTVTPNIGTCIGDPQNVTVSVAVLQGETVVTDSDCQACNGSIELSSSNGVAPLQFSNDGGVTFQASNVFGGLCGATSPGINYSFIIMDDLGCMVTVDDDVIDINIPTLNVPVVTDASCYTVCDGEIELSGTNLVNYTITSSGGTVTTNGTGNFTGLCPDTYDIMVDNGFGCSVTNTATITEPTPLQITSLTPDVSLCAGETVTLNVTGTGGNGTYTYTWTNGATNLGAGSSITLNPSSTMNVCVTMSESCPSPAVQQCMNITIASPIYPAMMSDKVSGCFPAEINFINTTTGTNIATTEWIFSDGGSILASGTDDVSYSFDLPGLYDVTMVVTTIEGCIFDATFANYIEVFDYPNALFTYMPNPATIYDTEVSFNDYSSTDVVAWNWNFGPLANPANSGEQNPVTVFPEGVPGEYLVWLYVTNDDGCIDSAQATISIVNDVIIFAPNIFTPDGDVFNEGWKVYIEGIDIYDFHLTIFNRWGEIVWESYNKDATWYGTYGSRGIVQDGTYVWVIEAKDSYNDKKYEFRGHVTVLK